MPPPDTKNKPAAGSAARGRGSSEATNSGAGRPRGVGKRVLRPAELVYDVLLPFLTSTTLDATFARRPNLHGAWRDVEVRRDMVWDLLHSTA